MKELHILLTDGLNDAGKQILQQAAVVDDRKGIAADELLQIAGQYDAFIVRGRTKVTAAVFDSAAKVKVIGRAGVGVDNIDLETAKQKGVTVVNAPEAIASSVAELTIGYMFALARSFPIADRAMKQGEWIKKQLIGIELRGKTLGVIGMGRIGTAVTRLAKALGMTVLGYDSYIKPEEIQQRGATPASLEALLAGADFITIHTPLTPQTKNLISYEAFKGIKPGAFLINAARGTIVNEDALLEALNSGQVAGAALDVFAKEPPGKTALVAHPKVLATPHIGGQTKESLEQTGIDIAQEVLAALEGKPLRWRIV